MIDDSEDWKNYKDMWEVDSSSCRFHWFPDTGMKVSWCKYCGKEGIWDWTTQTYSDPKKDNDDKSHDEEVIY